MARTKNRDTGLADRFRMAGTRNQDTGLVGRFRMAGTRNQDTGLVGCTTIINLRASIKSVSSACQKASPAVLALGSCHLESQKKTIINRFRMARTKNQDTGLVGCTTITNLRASVKSVSSACKKASPAVLAPGSCHPESQKKQL